MVGGGGGVSGAVKTEFSNFQFILIIVVGVGLLLALLMWLFDGSCLACNPVEYSVRVLADMLRRTVCSDVTGMSLVVGK